MSAKELELQEISKGYQNLKVLENCNLIFRPGLYGVLGENGAGKSTLIKLITANLMPDQGKLLYQGEDIWELQEKYRSVIGYMPQDTIGYPRMRVYDFMKYMAVLKGMSSVRSETEQEIMFLLEKVHLEDACRKRYDSLSGGMKRRVLLAQALLGNPEILILDEPTAGLDPRERMSMKNYISEQALDKIVILATHIISDVECAADQIVFMKKGEILGCQPPQKWISATENHVAEVVCSAQDLHSVQSEYSVSGIHQQENGILVRVVSDDFNGLSNFQLVKPTLEDAYVYYIIEESDGRRLVH